MATDATDTTFTITSTSWEAADAAEAAAEIVKARAADTFATAMAFAAHVREAAIALAERLIPPRRSHHPFFIASGCCCFLCA